MPCLPIKRETECPYKTFDTLHDILDLTVSQKSKKIESWQANTLHNCMLNGEIDNSIKKCS